MSKMDDIKRKYVHKRQEEPMGHVENPTGGSINKVVGTFQSTTTKGHEGPELALPAPAGSRQMSRCPESRGSPSFPPYPQPAHCSERPLLLHLHDPYNTKRSPNQPHCWANESKERGGPKTTVWGSSLHTSLPDNDQAEVLLSAFVSTRAQF